MTDSVMQDVIDPFLTPGSLTPDAEDFERITAGRYRLPDLTVSKVPGEFRLTTGTESRPGGWQRMTNLVKAIGDARALDLWHQRELIKGMVIRPDLYDLACSIVSTVEDPARLRRELESLAAQILIAAGADVGRNLGTAFHGFTDAQDQGMISYARAKWHGKLANYRQGLQAQGLRVVPEYIERKIVVLKYGAAGKLDRILWDLVDEVWRIGDLKSQKAFWTWIEISAQLAGYAMADAMWDSAKRTYVDMPPVAQDLGVVAWMPVAGTPVPGTEDVDADGVDFFNVDLEAGRRHLDLCYQVDRVRSEGRSAHQMIGLLRPQPGLALVEAYARRLDSVGSRSEGSALWAEITTQGLSEVPELQELAAEVALRFSGNQ